MLPFEKRILDLDFTIDPGFVNRRRIETLLGPPFVAYVDTFVKQRSDVPEWQLKRSLDRLYSNAALDCARRNPVLPISAIQSGEAGPIFCSVESIGRFAGVYKKERGINLVKSKVKGPYTIEIHYSTANICADTTRSELYQGADDIAILATGKAVGADKFILEPLVMGGPWLYSNIGDAGFEPEWYFRDFFEHHLEDFDQFALMRDRPVPADVTPMKLILETAFKTCLAEVLGDTAEADWGGETSDYFTSHLSLAGRRLKGAFLLKGAANFKPMILTHLGKNADQINRLAKEPADVLFVQHSHDITAVVRETLRAFAIQPQRPRRYCLIDGRDSLRFLQTFGLYEKARLLSEELRHKRRKNI